MSTKHAYSRDMIISQLSNGSKSFFVYNAINSVSIVYEAAMNTINGAPCLMTEYKYDTVTRLVLASRETVVEWDENWDFEAVVGV